MNICNDIPGEKLVVQIARDMETVYRAAYGEDYCEEQFDIRYERHKDELQLIYIPVWFYPEDCQCIEAIMKILLRKYGITEGVETKAGAGTDKDLWFEVKTTVPGWSRFVEEQQEA